jgi:hypothetical protein
MFSYLTFSEMGPANCSGLVAGNPRADSAPADAAGIARLWGSAKRFDARRQTA